MSIEDLTKHQIILLCFLIAFVSAVASAITVVTLMDQAPVTTSPTINKVIQQFIPGETREITKTNTVIIKEEDIIVESINQNKDSVITIHETLPAVEGEDPKDIINSSALIMSKEGNVIADNKKISGPGQYYYMNGETKIPLEFVNVMSEKFSLLKIKDDSVPSKLKYSPISKETKSNIGTRVILLSSNPTFSALLGSISSVEYTTSESGDKTVSRIITDISLLPKHLGGALINTNGDVIGFVVQNIDSIVIIPSSIVNKSISDYKSNASSDQTASAIGSTQKEGNTPPQIPLQP